MWNKPFEILNQTMYHTLPKGKGRRQSVSGVSVSSGLGPLLSEKPHRYGDTPHGFEISIGPKDNQAHYEDYDNATAESSLKLWKSSPKHHEVIINKGKWKNIEWKKIGAAVYGPFANVWFSE